MREDRQDGQPAAHERLHHRDLRQIITLMDHIVPPRRSMPQGPRPFTLTIKEAANLFAYSFRVKIKQSLPHMRQVDTHTLDQ